MAQKTPKLDKDSPKDSGNNNLLNLQVENKEKQVLEINSQMSSLESSIETLNKKLNTTNRKVKSEVNRLTTSDAEITDKVADTYRQMGDIENDFKGLSKKSTQINAALKKINGNIRAFEKETRLVLKSMSEEQSTIYDGFKASHDDLIVRAETLSNKVTGISNKLDKSIKENTKSITGLENKIVTELENVAQSSLERDNQLGEKINSAKKSISKQKANILLLQSVDQALDKRASALEQTSLELIKGTANLKNSVKTLDALTARMSSDIRALEEHTKLLAEQNSEQQGLIDSLGRTLLALANLETKHFRILSIASLLLFVAILGAFFYGEYMRDTDNAVEAKFNGQVTEKISGLQNQVFHEQKTSEAFIKEITVLENSIAELQGEMQQMTDQVESIDGRIQYLAPLYNFATDNTIHGSQWLANLDANKKSIKIATVADKQELYDIAQRYSYYFTDDLAYFITPEKQYTLIYGGQFETEQQISNLLRSMPRYMNNQLLASITNDEILQLVNR